MLLIFKFNNRYKHRLERCNIKYIKTLIGKAIFDIEHALDIYASSFVVQPAEAIYDKNRYEDTRDKNGPDFFIILSSHY